jgi:hypothetical protein
MTTQKPDTYSAVHRIPSAPMPPLADLLTSIRTGIEKDWRRAEKLGRYILALSGMWVATEGEQREALSAGSCALTREKWDLIQSIQSANGRLEFFQDILANQVAPWFDLDQADPRYDEFNRQTRLAGELVLEVA